MAFSQMIVIVMVHVLVLSHEIVSAYSIGTLGSPYSGTHESIASWAMDLLLSGGNRGDFDIVKPYRHEFLMGQQAADIDGGEILIPFIDKKVPRCSFSHFYNPTTKEGLRADPPVLAKLSKNGLLTGPGAIVLGPGMPSTELCDWTYARAVQEMRLGNHRSAFFHLSFAMHFVADATVPQHVNDCGAEKSSCRHGQYEKFVQGHLLDVNPFRMNNTITALDSKIEGPPSNFVIAAALEAHPLLEESSADMTTEEGSSRALAVAKKQVQRAVQFTAGFIDRFLSNWKSEVFTVVVVRIDTLKERKGMRCELQENGKMECKRQRSQDIDSGTFLPSDADFMPMVRIDGSDWKRRGYAVDQKNMDADAIQRYDINAWTYVQWVPRTTGKVRIELKVYDVFASFCGDKCGQIDSEVDLLPEPGQQHIEFDLDLDNPEDVLGEQAKRYSGCDALGNCDHAADLTITVTTKFPMGGRNRF